MALLSRKNRTHTRTVARRRRIAVNRKKLFDARRDAAVDAKGRFLVAVAYLRAVLNDAAPADVDDAADRVASIAEQMDQSMAEEGAIR